MISFFVSKKIRKRHANKNTVAEHSFPSHALPCAGSMGTSQIPKMETPPDSANISIVFGIKRKTIFDEL
jgi:hypothetical protein